MVLYWNYYRLLVIPLPRLLLNLHPKAAFTHGLKIIPMLIMLLPLTRRQIWLHLVRLQLPTLILAATLKYCINKELIFVAVACIIDLFVIVNYETSFIVGKTLKVAHKAHNPIYNETLSI
jgi:uncharacterized membrane protein